MFQLAVGNLVQRLDRDLVRRALEAVFAMDDEMAKKYGD